MFTCKQISKVLSNGDYQKLSPIRRFWLKLHVKFCVFCGKYNRQVIESQDMCRCYKDSEEQLATTRPRMDELQKDQLKALLSSHSSKVKESK